MKNIYKGIAKITLSPIRGIVDIAEDLSGNNGENSQSVSIVTLGGSSFLKGTLSGIKDASNDIFN